jgi:predicted DNA-binding ribbon-helix-helix protein
MLSSSESIAPVVLPVVAHPEKTGIDPFEQQFNMRLATPIARSVRLNGFATCLRLEEIYWKILDRIARANGCSVNAVLSHVDRQVHLRHGGVKNFSGLVRVICVVHLLEYPVLE